MSTTEKRTTTLPNGAKLTRAAKTTTKPAAANGKGATADAGAILGTPPIVAAAWAWPTDPAKLLVDYLVAQCASDRDAPKRSEPFINENDRAFVRSEHWIACLETMKITGKRADLLKPLRDLLGEQTVVQVPGELDARGKQLVVAYYAGPAPKGTEDVTRRGRGHGGGIVGAPAPNDAVQAAMDAITNQVESYAAKHSSDVELAYMRQRLGRLARKTGSK